MKRRSRTTYDRYAERDYDRSSSRGYDRSTATDRPKSSPFNFNYAKAAMVGGILIIGIVIGMVLGLYNGSNPQNVTSTVVIDRSAPNAELCQQYGAGALVTDMRIFVTLNPFKVFVTQPQMQPGCVLRSNNWALLEKQNLVSHEQVVDCKKRMNTFGFVRNLEGESPEIACIYPNDDAENLFLNKPGAVEPRGSNNNF
ncbi:MAG: DUF3172 domain-containing protein [Spirulinaceae cyanobacterium]